MTLADRVLPAQHLTTLDDFIAARGGSDAIEASREFAADQNVGKCRPCSDDDDFIGRTSCADQIQSTATETHSNRREHDARFKSLDRLRVIQTGPERMSAPT